MSKKPDDVKSPRGILSPRSIFGKSSSSLDKAAATTSPSKIVTPTAASTSAKNLRSLDRSGGTGGTTVNAADEAKVDADFRALLTAQGVPAAAQDKMSKTLDFKGKQDMLDQASRKEKKAMKTPASFVAQLKHEPDAETLRSLKVYLKTEKIAWLQEFQQSHGLAELGNILQGYERERNPSDAIKECIFECCAIVEAVAHEAEGLVMIMDPKLDGLVKTLILCLDTTDVHRIMVLYEFFSLLCNFSPSFPNFPYYNKVVECFNHYKSVKREPMVYFNLVESLKSAVSTELACKCVTLINSIVSTPEDLDTRSTQRTAFLRLGIRQHLLDAKTRIQSELFDVQFQIFFDDEKEDQQQLKEVTGSTLTLLGTGESVAGGDEPTTGAQRLLANAVKGNDLATAALHSIYDSLLAFPTDKNNRAAGRQWNLAASLLAELASGKSTLSVGNDVVLDPKTLLQQMDYKAELAIKERDFRSIEEELRRDLKKATTELNDTKQELSYLRERKGSAIISTPLMRPKEVASRESGSSLPPTQESTLSPEEQMAKHRLQEEEVFRLKQKVGEASSSQATMQKEAELARKQTLSSFSMEAENARLQVQLTQLKQSLEQETKKNVKIAAERDDAIARAEAATAAAAAGGGGGGGDFAAPPPPPPPPGGGGDFAAPPPPPPPPGGGGDFAAPPPPPPPPGGGGGPPPPPPPPGGGGGAPPPPPPPGGGGPPPPPPPGGFAGPPPPPGPGGFKAAAAKAPAWKSPLPKPEVKMRVLNWQKIPDNKVSTTVFNQIKDELSQMQLDWQEMQDLFRAPTNDKPEGAAAAAAAGPSKPQLVSVIGPKRTQSVNIFLKSYRMDGADVVVALNKFDQKVCTLEFLERFLENIPTPEEIASIDAYLEGGGAADLLAEPEKFFRDVSTVKGLKLKVQAFITLKKFPEMLDALKPQVKCVQEALEQVKESSKWKSVIRMVLAIGNYINGSSTRGDAMGFKLDSLNKLRDTKTMDNKSNLLNYLVQTLEKNEPATLLVSEDLKSVEAAKRVAFTSLSEDLAALTKQVANLEAAQQQLGAPEDPNDRFAEYVTPQVLRDYKASLNAMANAMQTAEAAYKELATSYGENPATLSCPEFLGIIEAFLASMHNARKELAAEKIKKEKAEKAEHDKALRASSKAAGGGGGGGGGEDVPIRGSHGAKAAPGQAMVVDELLQGLKSGALLKARTEARREGRVARTPQAARKEPELPPWATAAGRGKGRGAGVAAAGGKEQARLQKHGLVSATPGNSAPVLPPGEMGEEITADVGGEIGGEIGVELGEEVSSTPPPLPPLTGVPVPAPRPDPKSPKSSEAQAINRSEEDEEDDSL